MNIIPSNCFNEQNLSTSVNKFFKTFQLSSILTICNCKKLKGVKVMLLFSYILCNVFRDRSFYMQTQLNPETVSFSKNTYYRFLSNVKSNWLRFTTLLSEKIINSHIRQLTSDNRTDCFIVDDSLFERIGYKHTELVSKVFDHVSMKFKKGFRLMTLGWSDGVSFIPINFALLASHDDQKVLGPIQSFDKRSLAGRRRALAQTKGTDVMIKLLKTAINSGHKAKYVLFDSWFSNPAQLEKIKDLQMDAIAMIKRSSKIQYLYNREKLDIKQIFSMEKKRKGCSRYLLSVKVKVNDVDAKIVYVKNKNNRKDWIAIICTNTNLSEEEIISIYGKRWDIEVFFKTCKSFLKLGKEYHGLSYDALTAHVAIVFTRYMMLSVQKRDNEDERTLGELFYLAIDEMEDISFSESMLMLIEAMTNSMKEIIHATDKQLVQILELFLNKLPDFMKASLQRIAQC